MTIECTSNLSATADKVSGKVTFNLTLLARPNDRVGTVEFEILDPLNCVHFRNGTKLSGITPIEVSAGGTRLTHDELLLGGPGLSKTIFDIRATVKEAGALQCSRTAAVAISACNCSEVAVGPGLAFAAISAVTPIGPAFSTATAPTTPFAPGVAPNAPRKGAVRTKAPGRKTGGKKAPAKKRRRKQ